MPSQGQTLSQCSTGKLDEIMPKIACELLTREGFGHGGLLSTGPVAARRGVEGLRCGLDVVDRWAADHSAFVSKRGTVAVHASSCNGKIVGFCTLSLCGVARADASGSWFACNASGVGIRKSYASTLKTSLFG